MKTPAALLPDLQTLNTRIGSVLRAGSVPGSRARVIDRRLPRMMCTYPNEVVTCRLPDGEILRAFVKYQGDRVHRSFGHRGDVAYEARVYADVLAAYDGFRPKFLGAHHARKGADNWLLLEYLQRCVRVCDISVRRRTRQPRAMADAARWIGAFHRSHETVVTAGGLSFLTRHDAKYFRGWPERTATFSVGLPRSPWLPKLCERSENWMQNLLTAPPTVIHGEYYTKNLLLRRAKLYVVDWESAAIGAGEIDLAALIEGRWPETTVRRCVEAYARARWPEGPPQEFPGRLDAARIYLHFRWLGERPDWTVRDGNRWRLEELHRIATRRRRADVS